MRTLSCQLHQVVFLHEYIVSIFHFPVRQVVFVSCDNIVKVLSGSPVNSIQDPSRHTKSSVSGRLHMGKRLCSKYTQVGLFSLLILLLVQTVTHIMNAMWTFMHDVHSHALNLHNPILRIFARRKPILMPTTSRTPISILTVCPSGYFYSLFLYSFSFFLFVFFLLFVVIFILSCCLFSSFHPKFEQDEGNS